jgi:hypothetical protein
LVLENAEDILKMIKQNKDEVTKLQTIDDSLILGNLFVEAKLLFAFRRNPSDQKRLKYPKNLLPAPLNMTKEDFYSFNIKKKEKGILYVLGLASLVVLVILYPMWPYVIKLGVFYILYSLLMILLAINVLRAALWLVFWIFGFRFLLFPRLYDDDAGIIGSFIPFTLFEKIQFSGMGFVLLRIMVAILTCICVNHYVQVFSFEEL